VEHDKLREAEELQRETKALAEKLGPSIDAFETQSELRVNEVKRQRTVEQIERIVEEAMKKAEQNEDRIRRLRVLKSETWIHAYPFEVKGEAMIGINVMSIDAWTRSAARRRVIAGMIKRGERWLPVAEFKQRTEKVKSLLLKGDLDDVLSLDATRILFEIMNPNGKLQPRLLQHD
jgi:predicted RNase H-like nuclease (RuvC/YqgF family)